MKTVAVVGKNKKAVKRLIHDLRAARFRVTNHPEAVITLGGDGTYLFAERKYPGIPKIIIRDNSICNQCNENTLHEIINSLHTRAYTIQENLTLSATITHRSGRKKVYTPVQCTNDLILRNKDPTQALRYTVAINGKQIDGTLIGDGIVAATPFGSTAYFYSVTRKKFVRGIGLAFNNTTIHLPPQVLPETARITITIIRNDAEFAADNNPAVLIVHPGDTITITKAHHPAKIIKLKIGWKGLIDKLFNNRRRSLF